jgi:hypothetical protein
MMDPHQAIDLTQRLSRAGVRTEKFDFTAASMGRLALALYQAIRNATLALPNDTDLLDELRPHARARCAPSRRTPPERAVHEPRRACSHQRPAEPRLARSGSQTPASVTGSSSWSATRRFRLRTGLRRRGLDAGDRDLAEPDAALHNLL